MLFQYLRESKVSYNIMCSGVGIIPIAANSRIGTTLITTPLPLCTPRLVKSIIFYLTHFCEQGQQPQYGSEAQSSTRKQHPLEYYHFTYIFIKVVRQDIRCGYFGFCPDIDKEVPKS